MADNILGKVWSLDTAAGLVSKDPVMIHSIQVRFTTAGAGSCVLSTSQSTSDVVLDLKTTAASTAAVWGFDQFISFGDQTFSGLRKVLMVNVDTVYVFTALPR